MVAPLCVFALLAAPLAEQTAERPERPERRELAVDLKWELGVLSTTGALFLTQAILGANEDGVAVWDSIGPLDRWAREQLAAKNESDRVRALELSDALLWGAIPGAVLLGEAYDLTLGDGSWRSVALDVYTSAVAAFLAVQVSQVFKRSLTRSRPEVFPAGDRAYDPGSVHAFPSGHATNAAAFVASIATQHYMQGDPNWPWWAGGGAILAIGTGLARLGADNHWASDVLAGWALGTAVGIAYPLLAREPVGDDGSGLLVSAGPGTVQILWAF